MKESPKKVLNRVKRNFMEREMEKISQGLASPTFTIVVSSLNELRRLKAPFYTHSAVELLNHPRDEVVVAALRYLKRVEHPIPFEKMVSLLRRSNKIKREVAQAVTLCDYKSACELLKTLLRDPSSLVKSAALKSCAEIGCDEDVEYIKELSESEDVDLSITAIETLVELGEEVKEDELKRIIFNSALADKNRKKALKIFLKNSISPFETVKKVIELDYLPLTSTALEFLGNFKCENVWEVAEEILSKEESPSKLIPVLSGALKNCTDEPKLEKMAFKYLKHPSKKVRILSFKILMRMDVPQAKDIVNDFLSSSNEDLINAALPFVYVYPSRENVTRLLEILSNGDERSLVIALKTIRKLKIQNENVKRYLEKRYPLFVRKEALKTLVSLGMANVDELQAILLSDEDVEMKLTALEGIAKIAPEKLLDLEVA